MSNIHSVGSGSGTPNGEERRREWAKKDDSILAFSTTTMGTQEDALSIHLDKLVAKAKDADKYVTCSLVFKTAS